MAEPTKEDLMARIAELEEQGGAAFGKLKFKVSEKGGVSVYGLGRFPRPFITNSGPGSSTQGKISERFWK